MTTRVLQDSTRVDILTPTSFVRQSFMTEQERRKGGGGKLSRSETVTVRLDPKLRYLAELAARKQRRTLSSYIEWAIEDSLSRTALQEDMNGQVTTLADETSNLWDVDEADRFAKLALRYPHLLTHEEQVRWKLIRECGYLWRGAYRPPQGKGVWAWEVKESSLCFDRLRDKWDDFSKVANGEALPNILPTWSKFDPKHKTTTGFDDMDDDIPF
jgi:predicted transcriptional regulator